MKKILSMLTLCIPFFASAQTIDSVLQTKTKNGTLISLTLHRGEAPIGLPLEFSITYNYIDPTKRFEKIAVEKFYIIKAGQKNLPVSYTLPPTGTAPALNVWATTKEYFGLPIVIGKIPAVAVQ